MSQQDQLREIKGLLEQIGHPWMIVRGGKHLKIYLDGRFVGIFPLTGRANENGRGQRNLLAQIKRMARIVE